VTTGLTLLSFLAVTPLELSVDFITFLIAIFRAFILTSGQINLVLVRVSNDSKMGFFGSFGLGTLALTFLVIRLTLFILL